MRSFPLPPGSRVAWRAPALLIFGILFVSYAYFYQGTGWNQNSRFDLTRALLERHTVRIDPYHWNTGDKAFYQGHYYSDKAPGMALSALPPAWAALALAHGVHMSQVIGFQLYLSVLFTCSLAIALAAAVLFLLLLKWNISPGAAALVALIFGLGTPMWIYATQFWGHALAAACLVFAFAAADRLRESASVFESVTLAAIVGLTAGWAVVTEFPAALPAVMIGVMALICSQGPGRRSFLYASAALCVTAGLCLAIILVYQKVAFGSPFRLGYEYIVNYRDTLQHGALGVTYPRWHALSALLFGKRCGLLLFTPVLLVVPVGFGLLWRAGAPRISLLVSAGIALYYLLFNASYLHWAAGASFGPRYLSPGLPFACLFVAPVWQWARARLRALLAVLLAYGTALGLAGAASRPVIPESVTFPVREALPAFARGDLYQQGGAWNLGLLAGLHGLMSLAPLAAMWTIASVIWWRMGRRQRAAVISTHAHRMSVAGKE